MIWLELLALASMIAEGMANLHECIPSSVTVTSQVVSCRLRDNGLCKGIVANPPVGCATAVCASAVHEACVCPRPATGQWFCM
eukprot:364243-Chlamydomonas_euryale.AAC.7